MAISALDFANFLLAHNPKWLCSFCGNDKFHMNVSGTDMVADLAVAVAQAGTDPSTQTHNFYSLSCQRCGNTTWFHKAAVHRWLGHRNLPPPRNEA